MPGRDKSNHRWPCISFLNLYVSFTSLTVIVTCLSSSNAEALSLFEAYKLGLEHDPVFQQQKAERDIAEERYYQAEAKAYKPTLAISAAIRRNFQEITLDQNFGLNGETNFTDKTYSLDLTQPVFHYDRHIQLKQSDLDRQKVQFELDAAHQDLILRVAQTYLGVLTAQEDLHFSQAEETTLLRQRDQTEERFSVGLQAITDLHEAQAGADLAIARRLQAENHLDDAQTALREIIGEQTTLTQWPTLEESFSASPPSPANQAAWQEKALQENLQIKASQLNTDMAMLEIDQQKAGHLPTLDLVGSHGYRESGGMFGSTETDFSLIGLEGRLPLYEGGQVNSRTREALHRHEQALDQLVQRQRQITRLSREAYSGVMTGIKLIAALNRAVQSSETALEATRTGYEVGTRTAVDVVKADQELSRARKDYSQAKYQYILDTLRLKMAAGTLGPEDLRRLSEILK